MTTGVAKPQNDILAKLDAKQGHLSDYEFARLLGISRPLWQATRTGKRCISIMLLKAIARTYPDMHQDIIEFLRNMSSPALGKRGSFSSISSSEERG